MELASESITIDDIVYIKTKPMRSAGISSDNDQGMGYSGQCNSCIKWKGSVQYKADLIPRRGSMVCPSCYASYGAVEVN